MALNNNFMERLQQAICLFYKDSVKSLIYSLSI